MAIQCLKCGGTGLFEDDVSIGKRMVALRKAGENLTARTVAERMTISPTFLCDLEKGRRQWTAALQERYRAAVEGG